MSNLHNLSTQNVQSVQPNNLNMLVKHNNQHSTLPNRDFGFKKFKGASSTTEFEKSVIITRQYDESENIVNVHSAAKELISELTEEIIHSNIPVIETALMPHTNKIKVKVKMKIAPPNLTFVQVENDSFIASGEKFNEAEIEKALKIAYPERFV